MKAKDIEVGEVYAVGSDRWAKKARVVGIERAHLTSGYMTDRRHPDYLGNGYRRSEHGKPVAMVVYLDQSDQREQPVALSKVRRPWAEHEAAKQIERELAAEQQERREERLRGLVERIQRCVGVELANTAASKGRLDRASFTLDDLATFVEAAQGHRHDLSLALRDVLGMLQMGRPGHAPMPVRSCIVSVESIDRWQAILDEHGSTR